MMAEAEQEAAKWTASVLEQARLDCEEKKQEARGRLEQAVAFSGRKGCEKLMAIIKMKRLHLLALRSDREELLHTLQRMGCSGDQRSRAEADGRSDAPPGDWEGLTAVLELRTPDGSALTQVQEEKQSAEAGAVRAVPLRGQRQRDAHPAAPADRGGAV